MKKVKSVKVQETKFNREYELQVGTFTIAKGDIIKIEGEHGVRFKFDAVVTNTKNGKVWVDCFEMQKATATAWRSFDLERVKRIPTKRGRRKKNVN
jgi:hypothetical protein